MGDNFGTPYARVSAQVADFTALVADKADAYLVTAATVPVTASLYDPSGNFGGYASGRGRVRVINSASSRNYVVLATVVGSIVGQAILYPGQSADLISDGTSVWYNISVNGSGFLQTSVSAAQIIAMYTTPVSVVPAPATGKIVVVDHLVNKAVRTSTAFTGGGAVEYRYTDGSGAKVSADTAAAHITGAAGTAYSAVRGVTTELVPVAAAAIVMTNATQVFAAGTGTVQVSVQYRVVTP
jgi:hypothetical protein